MPNHVSRRGMRAALPENGNASPRAAARTQIPWQARVQPESISGLLKSVNWTLIYAGFLGYIFAIVTYRLPIGSTAIVIALIGLLAQRERLRFPVPVALFGLFVLWGWLGYAMTDYPAAVYEDLVDIGKVWLIMLVAVNALRTPAQIRFFMIFFLVSFAAYPARGAIFNFVIYRSTTFGRAIWNHIYANPNDLAALTLFPLALAAGLLASERGWIRKGALASVVVLPTVVLMTQSRGGVIALVVFGLFSLRGQKRKGRALAGVLAVAVIAALFAPSGLWERMAGLQYATSAETMTEVDSEGSAESRYAIWGVANSIIADQPLTGVGFGAYPFAHAQYATGADIPPGARGPRDTHNTYLNVLAEVGIPGLLLFLAVIATAVWKAETVRRVSDRVNPALGLQIWYLEAALAAYLVAAVFGSFAKLSFLYLHVAVLVALTLFAAQLAAEAGARGRGGAAHRPPAPARRGQNWQVQGSSSAGSLR